MQLAQDETVTDRVGSATEGVADLINEVLPEQLHFLVERLVSPGLAIVFIIVLAVVASTLASHALDRLVRRMKEPREPTSRWRDRMLGEADKEDDLRRIQRADALGALGNSIAKVTIWTIALTMALGQIGLELGPLIAGAGIVGVALGFGAQDLVKDFLSGVFMLIEDQYGVGDTIDAGEATGVVEGISLRSTRVRGVDGTLWHIPNGEIRRVGNMSQGWARSLVDIAVSYSTDIDEASRVILAVAGDMAAEEEYRELFLDDPELWGVEALANSSVDIRLVIKTVPGKQWAIARELRRRIKNAFDEAEVEIPYPQQVVWLRTEQAAALGDAQAPAFEPSRITPDGFEQARSAARRGGEGGPPPADYDDAVHEVEDKERARAEEPEDRSW